MLRRLKEKGVKLRADKCNFFKSEVRYLGRLISKTGYRADPVDTAALEKLRTPPKTIGELRSLLGFLGYYRCYVQNFSKIVKPLYSLLKTKDVEPGKGKPVGKQQKGQQYNAKQTIVWDDNLQRILDGMLDYLKSPKVIAFPNFELPFFMNCDASGDGLGAVLYQNQDGINRVISYASRTLTDTERNYHLHSGKLEFLALKWAITEKFTDYLKYGPPFTVYTDNNPLTYVLTTAKLNATGLRWVAELADYDFTIKYKPGKKNIDADYLSRRSLTIDEFMQACTEEYKPEELSCVISSINVSPIPSYHVSLCKLTAPEVNSSIPAVAAVDLCNDQKNDEVIGLVYNAVLVGVRPDKKTWKSWSKRSKVIMQSFKKLEIENGILLRKTQKATQIVLPQKYHQLVYTELHENMAHLSAERVIDLAQQRFYWAYMAKDITQYIRKRCRCVVSKKPNVAERAPMVPIEATYPF